MAHKHSIYDSDSHFKIDAITRAIRNQSSSKTTLIQGDHNSERFTFEMPRYIEGHDMSLCNVSRVHYLNGEQSGTYEIDDLQTSPNDEDVVICSWLISSNATGYSAPLDFLLEFACMTDDGIVEYRWYTAIFSGISIGKGMNNGDAIVYQYADVLEQWKQDLENAKVTDEMVDESVKEYLDANPVELDGKLDSNLGADNAGKHLVIDENGNVKPQAMEVIIGLPEITSANEEQFLQVVNGVATWVTVGSAEDGDF